MSELARATREMSDKINALPKPVRYVVLDPDRPPTGWVEGEDCRGVRYVLVSPSFLDALPIPRPHDSRSSASLTAIDLYRRQDMPEGWPDRWGEALA